MERYDVWVKVFVHFPANLIDFVCASRTSRYESERSVPKWTTVGGD